MIALEPFGRTGHRSSRTIFGAASLSQVTQSAADRTLDVLLQYGVNHIDTAAGYPIFIRVSGVIRRRIRLAESPVLHNYPVGTNLRPRQDRLGVGAIR